MIKWCAEVWAIVVVAVLMVALPTFATVQVLMWLMTTR